MLCSQPRETLPKLYKSLIKSNPTFKSWLTLGTAVINFLHMLPVESQPMRIASHWARLRGLHVGPIFLNRTQNSLGLQGGLSFSRSHYKRSLGEFSVTHSDHLLLGYLDWSFFRICAVYSSWWWWFLQPGMFLYYPNMACNIRRQKLLPHYHLVTKSSG